MGVVQVQMQHYFQDVLRAKVATLLKAKHSLIFEKMIEDNTRKFTSHDDAVDDQFTSTAQAVAELKRRVILRVPNQKVAALFMRTSGLSSLTANEISDDVMRLMKNAGFDISVFCAYPAKAA
ncbi:MAG: hypothetical protein EZS28_047194 [Streblomastix strix]|uniref:Uncharacterized protein n=1 Tax=Streblomastix strix TaxID=222440 RepID=A0A5J4THQ5_9EUKA|nr:MAG: hypothetical protein EZS28_047194 [Streblomastix strix]